MNWRNCIPNASIFAAAVLAANAQHWPLDAVVPSLKVHGRVTGAEGVQGKSLALDGGSLIELGDTGPLNGGAEGFTFSVWFNPYDLHRGQQVIAAKNRYSSGERQWSVALEADGTLRAYLHQEKWKTIPTTAEIKPGRWHLVTLTVSPSKAALYLNGRRAGEAALAGPIAPTAAPITLGGVNDKDHLRQQFLGAVDAARFEPRVLGADEIAASYHPVSVTHELPKPFPAGVQVWPSDRPVPKVAELSALSGMAFHVIKRHEPAVDGYPWLHGVGLAWHKGKLYASFGHNKGAENTASEEARGRVSGDGGKTWGDVFTIDTGTDAANLAISHGVFLSQGGTLWAFHGAFHGRMGNIHTRAYTLDEGTGRWQPKGAVIEGGFWPLNQPVKMTDGNWIMPGIRAKLFSDKDTNPAAVAISHGDDLLKWDMVAIPAPAGIKMWGESALLVEGPRMLNIARYGAKPLALAAVSEDHGRTWTESLPSNLPMATSKPCAGVLGNGQRYLICTTTADSAGRRAPLTIAVSRPGESMFRKVFLIRPAVFPAGPGESHERAALSYPCATEYEGRLYVGYSNSGGRGGNNNSAEMAVIPVDHLRVE